MYCLAADIHCHNWSAFSNESANINSRLKVIIDAMRAPLDECLANGANFYVAGDLFHVRGSLAPSVVNPLKDLFLEYKDLGVGIRILSGNHDLESNESSEMDSAVSVLAPIGVTVVNEPTFFPDDNVLMVPWMSKPDELLTELEKLAKKYGSNVDLIIHAPVNGVLIGIPDHGIWASQLDALGFKRVFCGHYHNHKKVGDTVWSIGALTHQTWSDVGTKAGYMIVDSNYEGHRETAAPKFVDIDSSMSEDDIRAVVPGNYVRLKIGRATEEQVKKARKELEVLGAAGVVIQSVPDTKIVTRTASVKAGASILQSINDWLGVNPPGSDKNDVTKLCEEILEEAEGEEA